MIAVIILGVLLGLGLWILVRGIVDPPKFISREQIKQRVTFTLTPLNTLKNQYVWIIVGKVAGAILAGLLIGYVTGWVGAGMLASVLAWYGPQIVSGMLLRRRNLARIESVALWAEQLRDLVTAGGSVSGSILLSAPYSPEPIRALIQKLSEETLAFGLPEALKRFAVRAKSPYIDRLSLGLKIADESGARLRDLLDDLAESLRASVEVRFRTEATQTRTLINGGVIMGITLVLAISIALLTPDYFNEYFGVVGQIVLCGVVFLYVMAIFAILQIDKAAEGVRLLEHLQLDEQNEQELARA